jgi:hypothetical protein
MKKKIRKQRKKALKESNIINSQLETSDNYKNLLPQN